MSDDLDRGVVAQGKENSLPGAMEVELVSHDGGEVVGGEFVSLEGVTEAV